MNETAAAGAPGAPGSAAAAGPVPLRRNSRFRLLWIGQVLSDTGTEAALIAYPLLILALTHSAAIAGAAGTARLVVQLVLGLPGGALSDRFDRRLTMIACDAIRAAVLGLLTGLVLAHLATWPVVAAVSVIDGAANALFDPSASAALPGIVADEQLEQAWAATEARSYGAGLAGPAPQRGQQQRRRAQLRPAAVLPVRPVRAPRGGAQRGDEIGRGSRPAGSLASPAAISGRSGAGTGSSGTGSNRCWYSIRSIVSPVNGGRLADRLSVPLSVLDLCPVPAGESAGEALRRSVDLARQVERWGFRRFWVAEHHNVPGIASSAPAVLAGQIASATSAIRVGSGG